MVGGLSRPSQNCWGWRPRHDLGWPLCHDFACCNESAADTTWVDLSSTREHDATCTVELMLTTSAEGSMVRKSSNQPLSWRMQVHKHEC